MKMLLIALFLVDLLAGSYRRAHDALQTGDASRKHRLFIIIQLALLRPLSLPLSNLLQQILDAIHLNKLPRPLC